METESKIKELEERIAKLEKAERKRVIKKRITIALKLIFLIIFIVLIFLGYNYVNNTIIKPYKEKIEYIDGKVGSVEEYINDKWDILQKINPFG